MYIRINNNKIKVIKYTKFSDKFKSFKFFLKKIDFGIFYKARCASTYFFCQRVDICFTDLDYKITHIYRNVKSEKLFIKFKSRYIFYLPVDTCKKMKVGDKLVINKK